MKQNHSIYLAMAFIMLSACTNGVDQGMWTNKDMVELPQKATYSQYELPYGMTRSGGVDTATIMTNENVIVYPVDGDINSQRATFPEYRGVMENTTSSGYTVFDPSVTVYPVDGGSQARPSYLPEYSVPRYVQPMAVAQSPMPIQGNGRLMPMELSQNSAPEADYNEPTPRAPRLTQSGIISEPIGPITPTAAPTRQPRADTARRSSPMLTGY